LLLKSLKFENFGVSDEIESGCIQLFTIVINYYQPEINL